MKTSPNDVSNQEILLELKKLFVKVDSNQAEILGTVQGLAEHMDEEFAKVRTELRGEFQSELSRFATKEDLESEMSKLKTTMVTKGYLDDKLADHHSEIILHTQREIQKALG
jgi:predicted DNA-binding WGR domain protein